jgi:hypothetical protein
MAKTDDDSRQEAGFDSNFDSRLMGAGEGSSSKSKAGALNEAKHQSENNEETAQQEPTTLREAVIAEKRKQQQEAQEQEKSSGLKNMAAAPMRQGTSELLKDAWINLIPSWGLTLIWINIHAFLSLVIGKEVFCRLGDEWTTGGISGGAKSINAIVGGQSGNITIKNGGSCANIGESMVLAILDLALIVIIIAILSIVAMLLKVVDNPLDFLSALFGWVWSSAKGIISS